jgi:hypothetical protein
MMADAGYRWPPVFEKTRSRKKLFLQSSQNTDFIVK